MFAITQTDVIPNAAQRNEPASPAGRGFIRAALFDVLDRINHQQGTTFSNNAANIKVQAAPGMYIPELRDTEGNATHQRITIE